MPVPVQYVLETVDPRAETGNCVLQFVYYSKKRCSHYVEAFWSGGIVGGHVVDRKCETLFSRIHYEGGLGR